MEFRECGWRVRIGLIWLRTETGDGFSIKRGKLFTTSRRTVLHGVS
jgi:hypothetical protein